MSMNEEFAKKTKKKVIAIASSAVALVLVVGIGVGVFATQKNERTKRYNRMIKTAKKDMTELDYEEAISAYEEAIELDPTNAKAYIGLADAYAKQGDLEAAKKVLEDAEKNVDKDQIPDVEDAKKQLEKEPVATTPAPTTPAPTTPAPEATTPAPSESDPEETDVPAPTETEPTAPELVIDPELSVPVIELYTYYLESHAADFGGFSTIGTVKGEDSYVNDGGEFIPPELADLSDSLSGIATFALSDVDGDGEDEAIVVSYDKNVENNQDNEYTAVVKLTVLDVEENIVVVASESVSTVVIGKTNTTVAVYTGSIDGKAAVAVTTETDKLYYDVSSSAVVATDGSFDLSDDNMLYKNSIVFTTVDNAEDRTVKYESVSSEYVDTSDLANYEERYNNPVAEVKDGYIVFDDASKAAYPELNSAVMSLCDSFLGNYAVPANMTISIVRSDAKIFSFVVKCEYDDGSVLYDGWSLNTLTGEIYRPGDLIDDSEGHCVITPENIMVFEADGTISYVVFPEPLVEDFAYAGNYMYNVNDFMPYTNVDGTLTIDVDGQIITMDSSKIDPATLVITKVKSYSGKYVYVSGNAADGSGAIVYLVNGSNISDSMTFMVNPFANFIGQPERFAVENNSRIPSIKGAEYYSIVDDGEIKCLGIAPSNEVSATVLEDVLVYNRDKVEFFLAEYSQVTIIFITDDYAEVVTDDGIEGRIDLTNGIGSVLQIG